MALAQSKEEAQLTVRVQQLEDQVRTLTGQIEGLQFTLTQLQTQLQKMSDDNEFRFQQLEGGNAPKAGAGKKTSAATPTGGATPIGALPQPATGEQTDCTGRGDVEPPAAPGCACGGVPPVDHGCRPPMSAAIRRRPTAPWMATPSVTRPIRWSAKAATAPPTWGPFRAMASASR